MKSNVKRFLSTICVLTSVSGMFAPTLVKASSTHEEYGADFSGAAAAAPAPAADADVADVLMPLLGKKNHQEFYNKVIEFMNKNLISEYVAVLLIVFDQLQLIGFSESVYDISDSQVENMIRSGSVRDISQTLRYLCTYLSEASQAFTQENTLGYRAVNVFLLADRFNEIETCHVSKSKKGYISFSNALKVLNPSNPTSHFISSVRGVLDDSGASCDPVDILMPLLHEKNHKEFYEKVIELINGRWISIAVAVFLIIINQSEEVHECDIRDSELIEMICSGNVEKIMKCLQDVYNKNPKRDQITVPIGTRDIFSFVKSYIDSIHTIESKSYREIDDVLYRALKVLNPDDPERLCTKRSGILDEFGAFAAPIAPDVPVRVIPYPVDIVLKPLLRKKNHQEFYNKVIELMNKNWIRKNVAVLLIIVDQLTVSGKNEEKIGDWIISDLEVMDMAFSEDVRKVMAHIQDMYDKCSAKSRNVSNLKSALDFRAMSIFLKMKEKFECETDYLALDQALEGLNPSNPEGLCTKYNSAPATDSNSDCYAVKVIIPLLYERDHEKFYSEVMDLRKGTGDSVAALLIIFNQLMANGCGRWLYSEDGECIISPSDMEKMIRYKDTRDVEARLQVVYNNLSKARKGTVPENALAFRAMNIFKETITYLEKVEYEYRRNGWSSAVIELNPRNPEGLQVKHSDILGKSAASDSDAIAAPAAAHVLIPLLRRASHQQFYNKVIELKNGGVISEFTAFMLILIDQIVIFGKQHLDIRGEILNNEWGISDLQAKIALCSGNWDYCVKKILEVENKVIDNGYIAFLPEGSLERRAIEKSRYIILNQACVKDRTDRFLTDLRVALEELNPSNAKGSN